MKAAFSKQLIDRIFSKGSAGQPHLTRFVGKSG
jgi:hypothetical protein